MAEVAIEMVSGGVSRSSESLEYDSDAVLSESPWLVRAGCAMVRGSAGTAVALAIGWGFCLLIVANTRAWFIAEGGLDDDISWHWIKSCTFGGCVGVISLVVFSLRTAEKQLRVLGSGSVKTSAASAISLKRWGYVLIVVQALFMVSTAKRLVNQGLRGVEEKMNPNYNYGEDGQLNVVQRLHGAFAGLHYAFVIPLALTWYLALKQASILVSDAVVEARKRIIATAPSSKQWDDEVVPMVLKLLQTTLPALSGFASGVKTGLF